ncbi:C40 family peptidase [Enterococcus gilvus]|uniref:C40 family peptidase n=1 Tax=Enterococcus gilvus TaxID=160453 RepID=UPI001C8C9B78|nr:C40 family peptidase [Enterococcus gilvus]MBX8937024.1 C40 family peptidase [Enterococcus gilvus]
MKNQLLIGLLFVGLCATATIQSGSVYGLEITEDRVIPTSEVVNQKEIKLSEASTESFGVGEKSSSLEQSKEAHLESDEEDLLNRYSKQEYNTQRERALSAGYTEEQFKEIMRIPKLESAPVIESRAAMTIEQQKVVNMAKAQLGKPYQWGADGPGSFDCGGLVRYVYRNSVGIDIPMGTEVQRNYGKSVSMNSLLPGDLLFWLREGTNTTTHVAIYIGNGQFIHSPQENEVVTTVNMSYLDPNDWYPSFARRILADAPVQKFKANDRVKIKKTATQWVGSSNLTAYDYTRVLIVESYQSNGVKVRIPGEWAGIIKEQDLEKSTPVFKKGDYVKIKRSATKWVGSSNLSEVDYNRTYMVEGINSNGAITIRIPGSWAGNIREEDLEEDSTNPLLKIGTKVSFNENAVKWAGSSNITYDDMIRSYKVSKINDNGTIYIRTIDDAWGGNTTINDLMPMRSNNIDSNDIIKLRAAATNWADGQPINIENKTTRSFIVKERKDHKLHIYSDAASGWSAWIYDWDAVLEREHKITPEIDYTKKYVVMNENSTVWNAYKGVSSNVKISLSEYDSVYKIVEKNSESTKIQSTSNSSVFGWVSNNQVSAAPNNSIGRGDMVKLKSSASNWANGENINIDNKTTRTFLVKERKNNQLLLYTDAGWQAWINDWDATQ